MDYMYFWGHTPENPAQLGKECLSQWYPAPFTAYCQTLETTQLYATGEHYMMYQKAILFGDLEMAGKILYAETPRRAKDLGRQVKGFDMATWIRHRERIVYEGNRYKFAQNQDLYEYLCNFHLGITFVEASPYDTIWGIGLSENDPKAHNPATWRGQNLLGKAITKVHQEFLNDILAEEKAMQESEYQGVEGALRVAYECGQFDGDHHKMWVIDQMVRALTGTDYKAWVRDYEKPDEGNDPDDYYGWDTGIAP